MTAADYQALSADLTESVAQAEGTTAQVALRSLIAAADAAYTAAVVAAVGGFGTWGDVQQAGIVAKQVKAGRA